MSETFPSGTAPAAAARAGTLTADAVPAPPPPPDAPVVDIVDPGAALAPPPPPPTPVAGGSPGLTATEGATLSPPGGGRSAAEPAWARKVPLFGPPGRRRSPAAVVGLTLVTLGWYAIAWHVRINRQVADFDPHMQVRPTRSAWAVALPLAAGWLAALAEAARVVAVHLGHAPGWTLPPEVATLPVLAAPLVVPYLILLVPFALVAVVMTVERVRTVQQRVDVPDDHQLRPAASAALLLVPVFGGLLLLARVQRGLNEAWTRVTH